MVPKHVVIYAFFVAVAATVAGCSGERKKEGEAMSANELQLTDSNFDAETSKGVVLIDFWAPWCGACHMQGPIIEKVADAMAGKAKVGKCNVDKAPKSAQRFGIRSIPTIVILKNGKEVERFVGVQQEAELVNALKKHIE